jgi:hypothetical protein
VGAIAATVAAGDDSRIVGAVQKANNLSDLTNIVNARTNLGLGGAALLGVGTAAGTVVAGDDNRITGALQKANNLSDLASGATARANLGLGGAALLNVGITAGGLLYLSGPPDGTTRSQTVGRINVGDWVVSERYNADDWRDVRAGTYGSDTFQVLDANTYHSRFDTVPFPDTRPPALVGRPPAAQTRGRPAPTPAPLIRVPQRPTAAPARVQAHPGRRRHGRHGHVRHRSHRHHRHRGHPNPLSSAPWYSEVPWLPSLGTRGPFRVPSVAFGRGVPQCPVVRTVGAVEPHRLFVRGGGEAEPVS